MIRKRKKRPSMPEMFRETLEWLKTLSTEEHLDLMVKAGNLTPEAAAEAKQRLRDRAAAEAKSTTPAKP